MNDIDVKEYFDEEDCDAIILYLIDKADLSYGQALQVLEMLGRMVNIAATRIAKEMGVI
ncbi:MAG: hypothetical protein J6D15_03265 [Clostridia bacterium]|nr:hypothetical protein [Clostridia bacterium]